MLGNKARTNWCFRKGLLKSVSPILKKSDEHIQKAKHNLKAADYNIKGGFSDWAISQTYYATYHALLAVLYRFGLESTNHECTISAVEGLIGTGKLKIDKKVIAFIRTTEQMKAKDAKSLREEFQYGTKTEASKAILDELLMNSKGMIEEIEIALQEER